MMEHTTPIKMAMGTRFNATPMQDRRSVRFLNTVYMALEWIANLFHAYLSSQTRRLILLLASTTAEPLLLVWEQVM